MKPKVSFVIKAFNCGKWIRHCINSIQLCDYPSEQKEIILVDGGSTDHTIPNAEPFGIKIIEQEKPWLPSQINAGIKEATGKYFMIIDGDSVIGRHFVTKAIDLMESNENIGLTTGQRHQIITNLYSKIYEKRFILSNVPLGKIHKYGGNAIFNKEAWLDSVLELPFGFTSGEEEYISICFRNNGKEIHRIKELSMLHLDFTQHLYEYELSDKINEELKKWVV